MIDTRLGLACRESGLNLRGPGRVLAVMPSQDAVLAELPQDETDIVQDVKPVFAAWEARGFQTLTQPQGPYSAAVVSLPRAKKLAQSMIYDALACTEGPVIVDGQKTDGVESILRQVRKRQKIDGQIAKAHGKLFWFEAEAGLFEDWACGPERTAGGFWTAPGVFSADGIDPASALLATHLPDALGKRVADLGAGWGFLSAHVLTRPIVETVHLVEASHIALECAKRNVTDPRAAFHWADATTWKSADAVDTVVMNPPFHQTRAATPELGQSFIEAAARMLTTRGQVWMVANRHLPYEATLAAHFADVREIGDDPRFKIFHASRPKRAKL
ncbi:MAG: class I SAM-dependent methyltransferase [Roseobacter sp.]